MDALTEEIDGDLLQSFVDGEATEREHAFAGLVHRHGAMVVAVARRHVGPADADDVAQAAFLVLARKASALRSHPSLAGWLHRVARNIARRHRDATGVRSRRERQAVVVKAADEPVAWRDDLDEALAHLPERYRTPLVLHYLEGCSQEDVARTLDVPAGTLASLLSRGRDLLRTNLARRGVRTSALAILGAAAHDAAAAQIPAFAQPLAVAIVRSKPLSPGITSLANGEITTMALHNLSLTSGIAASLVAILALGLSFGRASAQEPVTPPKPAPKPAATSPAKVGFVPHIKVLSDKVPDVSSIDAWKKSYITEGMTDEQKGMACWKSVWTYQYQDGPPCEFLQHDDIVYDAIKVFNVYGYAMCGNAAAHMMSLARNVGLEARSYGINAHSVGELKWGGSWHLLDPSLINYFPKADGQPASVAEMTAGVQEWLKAHPECMDEKGRARGDKIKELHAQGGWMGWKQGPEILSRCPTWGDRGWYPAKTHGWYSTMQEYDGGGGGTGNTQFLYEYGASEGYQVDIRLRPGEKLVRNWSNKGLHVNMGNANWGAPGCLNMTVDQLVYSRANGDLTNGRVGNGTHDYVVPLADGTFKAGAWQMDNLACTADDKAKPALHAKNAADPASLVIRMPTSYVYLTGTAKATAVVGKDGSIAVQFSDNNGLDWKDVSTINQSGETSIDLAPFAVRRYDYLLKLTLKGAGTGLDALTISHDVQHSQRALPALAEGDNAISFSAGMPEQTITAEAATTDGHEKYQVTPKDFHAVATGLSNYRKVEGKTGDLTVPISTPADMVRLRFGGFYRNWSDQDSWEYHVSFDDGKTFKKVCDAPKQMAGCTKYITVSDIPTGTRKALVRYVGNSAAATMLWSFRIDADYVAPNAGFAPVKVTYTWDESGQEKTDVHIATKAEDTYKITCGAKTTMKSIALELAP
ncbi:MAG: RNA polymerase sigma factor [Planctomycetes bacterium]|nr:RNA polymerase sigma factor [Planctomycetota bacterium]